METTLEKRRRPFRLATTSFIYPDHIIPNVRQIGHLFDEIELLIFESQPDGSLPSLEEVRALARLGQDLDLTYNIHLPVDVDLAARSAQKRQLAADTLKKVIDRFAPLAPTTQTLHLDLGMKDPGLTDQAPTGQTPPDPDRIRAWEERSRQGLDLLVPHLVDPSTLCVETLWYDPGLLAPLVKNYDLAVCADLGHHFKHGHDPAGTFEIFEGRIPLIHLHGVDQTKSPPRDHLGLDRLDPDLFARTATLLSAYQGTLSIEVFGKEALAASLERLGSVFDGIPEF